MTGGHAEDQDLAVARAGRGEAAVGREAHVRHCGAVVALRGDYLHGSGGVLLCLLRPPSPLVAAASQPLALGGTPPVPGG